MKRKGKTVSAILPLFAYELSALCNSFWVLSEFDYCCWKLENLVEMA